MSQKTTEILKIIFLTARCLKREKRKKRLAGEEKKAKSVNKRLLKIKTKQFLQFPSFVDSSSFFLYYDHPEEDPQTELRSQPRFR